MKTCPHCGGVVGQDCFNVEECGEITHAMEVRRQQNNDDELWADPVTRYCDEDGKEYARGTPQELANQIKALRASAELILFHLAHAVKSFDSANPHERVVCFGINEFNAFFDAVEAMRELLK